jgi:hypothetical protein
MVNVFAAIHPIEVAKTVATAMVVGKPPLRYKVGIDSKISPLIGVIPTGKSAQLVCIDEMIVEWRENMLAKQMFNLSL